MVKISLSLHLGHLVRLVRLVLLLVIVLVVEVKEKMSSPTSQDTKMVFSFYSIPTNNPKTSCTGFKNWTAKMSLVVIHTTCHLIVMYYYRVLYSTSGKWLLTLLYCVKVETETITENFIAYLILQFQWSSTQWVF